MLIRIPLARTKDEKRTEDEEMHVRPAIGNTFVSGRLSSLAF